jgi:hypothetical protein
MSTEMIDVFRYFGGIDGESSPDRGGTFDSDALARWFEAAAPAESMNAEEWSRALVRFVEGGACDSDPR